MWLKKSQQSIDSIGPKQSGDPVIPSSEKPEASNLGVWLSEREAMGLTLLLEEKEAQLAAARELAEKGLALLKAQSLQIATTLSEETIKLKKTQQIATVAVALIKNQKDHDLKTQLAASLKEIKEKELEMVADTRKDLIQRYAKVSEIDALELTLDKLGADSGLQKKALALLSNLQPYPAASSVVVAKPVAPVETPPPSSNSIKSPTVARFADIAPSTFGASMDGSVARGVPQSGFKSPTVAPRSADSGDASVRSPRSPRVAARRQSQSDIVEGAQDDRDDKQERAEEDSSRPSGRPPTEVIAPFVEVTKFSSQYDPDAKFERVQPGVPRGLDLVKPSGPLPRMGRKEPPASSDSRQQYTGSACPVCSKRFPDQQSLIAHIESCAASSSPMPPQREAPPQPSSASAKAANLIRKVTAEIKSVSPRGASPSPPPQQRSGAAFISAPTSVSHDAHTDDALVTMHPGAKKANNAPRKPAPKPPASKQRPRSRTGGGGVAPEGGALSRSSRTRSMSFDSPQAVEDVEDLEEFLEVVFTAGEVSLDALNASLAARNASASDAELLIICRLGQEHKRQLEPFMVSTVLAFRKDQAIFSGVQNLDIDLAVGLFLTFKASGARETIGSLEIELPSVLHSDQEISVPLRAPRSQAEVGRLTFSARVKTRSAWRSLKYQHVSFERPLPSSDEPLTKAMSAARYAATVGLSLPAAGQSSNPKAQDPDVLIAAYESWPPRYAECCRLIKEGHPLPYMGSTNSAGQTLLHIAAIFGDVDCMQVLLDATSRNDRDQFVNVFDRNRKDRRQFSALHYAIIYDHLDCLELLLRSGASIDSSYKAMQPIHLACLLGKEDAARILIDHGADPDAQDLETTATPLFYAAFGGFLSLIEMLIAKGAFLDAEDRSGLTPLLVAGIAENVPVIVSLLHRSAKPIMSSYDGKVMLPWTVLNAEHPELRALLSRFKRETIVARYPLYERTLLIRSILCLNDEALMEAISLLLDASGRDARFLNAPDAFGKRALHYACILSLEPVIRMLIEAGAAVSVKDEAGNTPLHVCLSPVVAEILLQNGANVNEQNNRKMTPLHLACSLGLLELRALYKGWGAKEIRNAQGLTPKEVMNLVAPKHYKVQIKMAESDLYDEETGGLVLRN